MGGFNILLARDESFLIDDLQGYLPTLLQGCGVVPQHIHASANPHEIGILPVFAHQDGGNLEVDVLHAHLAVGHIIVILGDERLLVVLKLRRNGEGAYIGDGDVESLGKQMDEGGWEGREL